MSFQNFPLSSVYPVDATVSDLVALCPGKGVLFTGSYSRNGTETGSTYGIESTNPPGSLVNASEIYQILDFVLDQGPSRSVNYFGSQTQRLSSYPTDPTVSVIIELLFLSVTVDGVIVGSLNAQTSYPDKGSGSVSSAGEATYPVFTASGFLSGVKSVLITFFPDKTRLVRFVG